MQKVLDNALRLLLVFCFLISPLIFLTDFTKNPYTLQNVILVFGGLGSLLLLWAEIYKQKILSFAFSKADIIILIFIALALISLLVNILTAENSAVFLNEFLRRGDVLITNMFCGYFLARLIFNRQNFLPKNSEEKNYKTGLLLLLWGALWLPFGCFRMKGVFDIYALLVWIAGCYISLKILKEITIKNILDILLAVCALACIYGICQNMGFEFLWPFDIGKDFGNRSISTFGNPTFLSSFIVLFLPLGIIYLLESKSKLEKFYYFFISLSYTTCLAITQTRSSWLGAFVAFVILFSSKEFRNCIKQRKKIFISFIFIAFFLFMFWPEGKTNEYKSLVLQRSTQESLIKPTDFTLAVKEKSVNQAYHQRLLMWACGIDNFKQKPLLGWGWGSWQLTFAMCQGKVLKKYPALSDLKTQSNSAHNIFVETLSQSGIVGLCVYLVFLVLIFLGFKKYYITQKYNENKLFVFAVFAGAGAFLTDNMLNITSQVSLLSFYFYFFLGILASLEVKSKKISKVFMFFCLILCTFIFVFFNYLNYKNIRSEVYSFKAYKEASNKRFYQAKNLLDKALVLSKNNAEDYYLQVHTLINIQDFTSLEIVLKKALKYFPYFYEFNFNQALLEEKNGNFKQAFLYLKKTLALYPYYEPALKALLNLIYSDERLKTLENANFIETLPLSLSYQNAYALLLCEIYFKYGYYQKARELLLSQLSKNSFDIAVQEKLQEVNNKLGIKQDLILQQAVKLTALRKQVLSADKISQNLLSDLQKEAKNLDGQMLLAQAYFKNKEYQKSRAILEALYKDYKDSLPLNFAYASLEEVLGNKEDAKKYLQAVLSIDKNNSLALRRLENLK